MNYLLLRFEFVSVCIDDLLILTKGYWPYYVHKLELNLNKLKDTGLKSKNVKFFLGKIRMEYLGFWITHNGIKPIS